MAESQRRRSLLAARAVRREVGDRRLSSRQVGELIGAGTTAARRRITGDVAFTLDELQTLADAWGLPLVDLLGPLEL
jgi:hypothetical protein